MPMPDSYITVDVAYGKPDNVNTNRYYYSMTAGVIDASNVVATANQLYDLFATKYKDVLCTTAALFGVHLHFKDGEDDIECDSTNALTAGTVTGDWLPEEDAVVIRCLTFKTGRWNRGRRFIGYVPEAFQQAGRLNSDGIEAYQSLATRIHSWPTLSTGQTLKAMHYDHKNSLLVPMNGCSVVIDVLNRRDRRKPKELIVVQAA